jgi:glutaredoxin-related protein
MLKIYGSPLCPDCMACKASLDAAKVPYEFVDITASMANLKAFLRLRDSLPLFDEAKMAGAVGIPCLISEDGSMTLDYESWLAAEHIPKKPGDAPACRLDGSGC